jgi:hypothetical protein
VPLRSVVAYMIRDMVRLLGTVWLARLVARSTESRLPAARPREKFEGTT